MAMAMQVHSIEGNTQRLDGGSMFGNCPRVLWERWCPADDKHRINLACRSMLVREEGGRNVLLETGVGSFFEPRLRERFGVQESEHLLLKQLAQLGLRPEDIDVIILSHLHFDHAGGLLTPYDGGKPLDLAFPKATVVVGKESWARAKAPHPRDRASFLPELNALLEASGRLEVVDGERSPTLGDLYSFSYSNGHTPGLMLTRVETPRGPVTFMGDLIPGTPWVHLPITMGYDRYPELIIDEKHAMLDRVIAEDGWAFFTHDPEVAASKIGRDERGKYTPVDPQAALAW